MGPSAKKGSSKGAKGKGKGAAAAPVYVLAPVVAQIQEENWACCDKCQKWRRLPAGMVVDEELQWCGGCGLSLSCRVCV